MSELFTHGLGFALGTIPFGSRVSREDTWRILDRFLDAGGTTLDTADNYCFWTPGGTGDESESAIGSWLAARGTRDRVVISTKVGARPAAPGEVNRFAGVEGLSAATVRQAIQGSLRRLGTDHVDVYWAHIEDRAVPLEETLGAFHALVGEGTVRALGASNLPTWRLERARLTARTLGLTPYTQVQLRHTYLVPRTGAPLPEASHVLATDEMQQYVREEPDLTLWAYNPLMFGAYTRPDRKIAEAFDHPGTVARMGVLQEVARERSATLHQVVLAWMRGHQVLPIVGVSTLDQLEEAIGSASIALDQETMTRLDAPR